MKYLKNFKKQFAMFDQILKAWMLHHNNILYCTALLITKFLYFGYFRKILLDFFFFTKLKLDKKENHYDLYMGYKITIILYILKILFIYVYIERRIFFEWLATNRTTIKYIMRRFIQGYISSILHYEI